MTKETISFTKLLDKTWMQALLLAILCFVLYFINLDNTDLVGSDETRYSEVAREMVVDHQWVIPHFNGEVYYNKPPLFFWFIAVLSKVAGSVNETTARLPSAISALAIVLAVYFLGIRLINRRVGLVAALVLASNPEFMKFARLVRLDMTFTLFITISFTAFYFAYTSKHLRSQIYY